VKDKLEIDGIELSPDEKESYNERIAICVEDGFVGLAVAIAIARQQIRLLRSKPCKK